VTQFSGSILALIFKEQTEKWEPLVLAHISKAIAVVHSFIVRLLEHICPDTQIRTQLWDNLVMEKVRGACNRAMDHARFLLSIERGDQPSTFNHYFNAEVQKKRLGRVETLIGKQNKFQDDKKNNYMPTNSLRTLAVDRGNMQQTSEDSLDVLTSYYKVSRKRFVNAICMQVIGHFLLKGEQSPLTVFNAELAAGLDDEQLEMIAGEDGDTKVRRGKLQAEIKNLEAAMMLLR
jgi:hypothetical protein